MLDVTRRNTKVSNRSADMIFNRFPGDTLTTNSRNCSVFESVNVYFTAILADIYWACLLTSRSLDSRRLQIFRISRIVEHPEYSLFVCLSTREVKNYRSVIIVTW